MDVPDAASQGRTPAAASRSADAVFLAHIVRPTAAALTDAAAEDQHIDQAAVVHVEVEPVVEARPDDNHRTTVSFIGVIGKFTGGTDDMRAETPVIFSAHAGV